MNTNLFCKIFVDGPRSCAALVESVANLLGGRVEHSTAVSTALRIEVRHNSEANELRKTDEPDGFLYYPYSLETELESGAARAAYVTSIGSLLEGLWRQGNRAVAACDFEGELPRKGGYG